MLQDGPAGVEEAVRNGFEPIVIAPNRYVEAQLKREHSFVVPQEGVAMNLNDLKEIDRTWTNTPVPLVNPKPPLHIALRCIGQCFQVFFSILSAVLYIAVLTAFSLVFAGSALIGGILWIGGRLVRRKNANGKGY